VPICRVHGAVALLVLTLAGCAGPAADMDCSGEGSVRGEFSEINTGAFTLRHGLAWRGEGGYIALFTPGQGSARALLLSPAPEREAETVMQLLGESLLQIDFDESGRYRRFHAIGRGSISGWSSDHRASLSVDTGGCARGRVDVSSYGSVEFALPLHAPGAALAALQQPLEAGSTALPEPEPPATNAPGAPGLDDPQAAWAWVHARLDPARPLPAFATLGLSPLVAQSLAGEPRAIAALERLRSQCPDPASARPGGYFNVEGEASTRAGKRLAGDAQLADGVDGPQLVHCRVLRLVGERWHECEPIQQDCSEYASP
jgi:hypothetical protein